MCPDQTVVLGTVRSAGVRLIDPLKGTTLIFLTNNFELSGGTFRQVNQGALADHGILWSQRKRGQESDLDRDGILHFAPRNLTNS